VSTRNRIHSRNIAVHTFEVGENELLIEGSLQDHRFFPSYLYTIREFIEAGTIHDIRVTLKISLPELVIEEAGAEMETVPDELCKEVKDTLQRLVGIRVRQGFTHVVKTTMGGGQGCLHMTNLILAMGSAAVQGQWAYYTRRRSESQVEAPDADLSLVANSCRLWREDGPYYQRMLKLKREQKEKK
jgi:hypothetical protein